jgi:hypothetical protein
MSTTAPTEVEVPTELYTTTKMSTTQYNRWEHPCYAHLPTAKSIIDPQHHHPLEDVLDSLRRKSVSFTESSAQLRDKYYVSISIGCT